MSKFVRRGTEKWVFAPAVASLAAPTRTEITAGTILTAPGGTAQLAATSGFTGETSQVPFPAMSSLFTPSLPGEQTVGTPSLTFYDDTTATAIRTALADGATGFIIRMPYGDVPTRRCSVWPIIVGGTNDGDATTANEPATFTVSLGITDVPQKTAVIPA